MATKRIEEDLFSNNANSKDSKSEYGSEHIEVLEGCEAIRKRPAMYIGGTGVKEMHHLVCEVFDNSMDEVVAGFATTIEVQLSKENIVSIADNGRGIPIDKHPKYPKKTALEVIMTMLHSGGKFSNKAYTTSGGLHGVGLCAVNALSDNLKVEIIRDGILYEQNYQQGNPIDKLQKISAIKNKKGTKLSFHPDYQIFKDKSKFSPEIIYNFIKSKAYLYPGVTIKWQCDESLLNKYPSVPSREIIKFDDGIAQYINDHIGDCQTITTALFHGNVTLEDKTSKISWSIHWSIEADNFVHSFCNTIPTPLGGTHENGFRLALVKGLKDFAELVGNKKAVNINSDDVSLGACAVISIFITEPQFQGQTKEKLMNREVNKIVENTIKDHFDHWLTNNKEEALKLLDFVVSNADDRLSKKSLKDIPRKTLTGTRLRLPGKLTDCSGSLNTELFIVEGDSAGGSAKMARDRKTQAILPLRGKILNVASATSDKIKANQEIADLSLVLGCGTESQYNDKHLRYDKVIIMTDADVDGAHIASLLMTFFYQKMPLLIKNGHLYLAQPPLYKITHNHKTYYALTDKEKDKIINKLEQNRGKIDISRFKGLGEMSAVQLKETTMNPEKRVLLRVAIDEGDIDETHDRVESLMGKKPELRFKFITEQTNQMGKEVISKLDV